jgi:IPT/TIG domain
MTLSSAEVTLTSGRGSLTASVTNGSVTPERVVLGAFRPGAPLPSTPASAAAETPRAAAPASGGPVDPVGGAVERNPTWTTIDRPLRTIGPGATEQYEVAFDTAGAEPGTYPVKLIPYSADEAPEDYADLGVVVRLVVPAPETVPPKPKRFPWWIAAVAGAVVLIAVAVWVFVATRGPEPALASYSPSSGPVTGGTEVHIVGRFQDPVVISLGDRRFEASRVDDEEYVFTTPPVEESRQAAFLVDSDGRSLGAVLFEYQPLAPPTAPVAPNAIVVRARDAIAITWQAYACPPESSLTAYEIRLEPSFEPRIAEFLGPNPTSPAVTQGVVQTFTEGRFTIFYQAICGSSPSGYSPPATIDVFP